jgi:hypothetical protein
VQKFWLCEWIDGWTTVYHNMSCLWRAYQKCI